MTKQTNNNFEESVFNEYEQTILSATSFNTNQNDPKDQTMVFDQSFYLQKIEKQKNNNYLRTQTPS